MHVALNPYYVVCFYILKIFLKKVKNFLFKINFFMFLNYFDVLISKIIFLKKIILIHFTSEKHFIKQPQPHFQALVD
jgi:hypothetical protein